MNRSVRFTIVIPTYNRAHAIERCLDSVVAQTYRNWECIVVDDGSTDATADVVSRYVRADGRFRYASQSNAGASAARNAGIELASGDWTMFLDSDDRYYPDALELMCEGVVTAQKVGARLVAARALAKVVPPSSGGDLPAAQKGRGGPEDGWAMKALRVARRMRSPKVIEGFWDVSGLRRADTALDVNIQATAFARSLLDETGGFITSYVTSEDRDFLIRATACSPVVFLSPHITEYRVDGSGKSDRYLENGRKLATHRQIYLAFRENPLVRQRVARTAEESDLDRRLDAYDAMLDAAEHIRAEDLHAAAGSLVAACRCCRDGRDFQGLVARFMYFITYPRNDVFAALTRIEPAIRRIRADPRVREMPTLCAELDHHMSRAMAIAAAGLCVRLDLRRGATVGRNSLFWHRSAMGSSVRRTRMRMFERQEPTGSR